MRRTISTLPLPLAVLAVVAAAGPLVACGGDGGAPPGDQDASSQLDTAVDTVDGDDVGVADGIGGVDADGDAVPDAEPDADTSETDIGPDVASSGHPAKGLRVRITDPTGAEGAAVASGTVRLTGLLFGDASAMQWQLGAGSGAITPLPYWQTPPIQLSPGDNAITVTASDGETAVSDIIIVTWNSNYRFGGRLGLSPDFAFVGETRDVAATVAVDPQPSAGQGEVELVEVDAGGGFVRVVGVMRDDGGAGGAGDEIEGDRVRTWRGALPCDSEGERFLRVRVPLAAGGYALSEVQRFDCLRRVTRAACASARAALADAESALAGGTSPEAVASALGAADGVAAAGAAGDGARAVWAVFDDGFGGVALGPSDGTRGGGLVAAAQWVATVAHGATPLGSLRAELGTATGAENDEIRTLSAGMEAELCPPFSRDGAIDDLGLPRLRALGGAGIVALAAHGTVVFGASAAGGSSPASFAGPAQEVFISNDASGCDDLLEEDVPCLVTASGAGDACPAGLRCQITETLSTPEGAAGRGYCLDETQAELRRGAIALAPSGFAVLPAFFERWVGDRGLSGAFVYVGACSSAWGGGLMSTLAAAGAVTVVGFTDRVGEAFASETGAGLLEAAVRGDAIAGEGVAWPSDLEVGSGRLAVVGADALDAGGASLLNGDFGAGSLGGWAASGDGRVVSRFGDAGPVTGKFMGVLSTGLGYTVGTGAISQTICIPDTSTALAFHWRFYSEEFREWCGQESFQDNLSITATTAAGFTETLARLTVDDLCGYTDGTCAECPAPSMCDSECFGQAGCLVDQGSGACEGEYPCQCGRDYGGLEPADIQFDQGGVWRTEWRQSRIGLSRFAGRGPVTLTFAVSDSGDSLFDSAVLLDALTLE